MSPVCAPINIWLILEAIINHATSFNNKKSLDTTRLERNRIFEKAADFFHGISMEVVEAGISTIPETSSLRFIYLIHLSAVIKPSVRYIQVNQNSMMNFLLRYELVTNF